jgi:hypothetical protein
MLGLLAIAIVLVSAPGWQPVQAGQGDAPQMIFCIVAATSADDEKTIKEQKEAIAKLAKDGTVPGFAAATSGAAGKSKAELVSQAAALALPRVGLSDLVAGSLLKPAKAADTTAQTKMPAGFQWIRLSPRAARGLEANENVKSAVEEGRKKGVAVEHPVWKYLIYSRPLGDKATATYLLIRKPRAAEQVTENDLKSVKAGYTDEDGALVLILFKPDSKARLTRFTKDAIKGAGKEGVCHLAIVVKDRVIQLGTLRKEINTGRVIIKGRLTRTQAKTLAGQISALLKD